MYYFGGKKKTRTEAGDRANDLFDKYIFSRQGYESKQGRPCPYILERRQSSWPLVGLYVTA